MGTKSTTGASRRFGRAFALALSLLAACTAPNPAFEGVAARETDAGEWLDSAARDLPPASPDRAPAAPDAAASEDALPDAAPTLPPDAAPPDVAVDRAPPGAALLVVGETALSKSDTQLKTSLMRLGFAVVTRDGQDATAADATGKALVVISGSSWSDDVGGKFRDVPVPVIAFDDALFGPMKLTGTRSGTDYGSIDDQTRLLIVDDAHPLAGALSGLVTVASPGIMVSWGVPSSAAVKIATPEGQPDRFAIFGYTEGSSMVGMVAPARRVGSFVRFPDTASYTDSGLLLFEASALWAIGHLD